MEADDFVLQKIRAILVQLISKVLLTVERLKTLLSTVEAIAKGGVGLHKLNCSDI